MTFFSALLLFVKQVNKKNELIPLEKMNKHNEQQTVYTRQALLLKFQFVTKTSQYDDHQYHKRHEVAVDLEEKLYESFVDNTHAKNLK
jgi:hypothetical protein